MEPQTMLINLSNHPSADWPESQRRQALAQYGEIVDLTFPDIPPDWSLERVRALAAEFLQTCVQTTGDPSPPATIHVMGEMTFTYQFVKMAEERGIPCVASTTRRIAEDRDDGTRVSRFEFVRFRPYFDDDLRGTPTQHATRITHHASRNTKHATRSQDPAESQ
jgi:hypothetical protein